MNIFKLALLLLVVFFSPYSALAEDAQSTVPQQLFSKSVVITYLETRKSRPEEGGPVTIRTVPNKLIVYVSRDGNVFNRLIVGRKQNSSDQTPGSTDPTQFADRKTIFEKNKLIVANMFGGKKGLRTIDAFFDDGFRTCTATAVIAIQGEFARQRKMTGGIDLLYSASASDVVCNVVEGNELMQ